MAEERGCGDDRRNGSVPPVDVREGDRRHDLVAPPDEGGGSGPTSPLARILLAPPSTLKSSS